MVVIYQKVQSGQGFNDLWKGEMDEPTFWKLDRSPEELKKFLKDRGIEFDPLAEIELDELLPEVAANRS